MIHVLKRIAQLRDGLITEKEFHVLLDKHQIRGTVDDNYHFIGYDYCHQTWIEI